MTRSRIFDDTEQGEVDLFDVKCKEWGFLLKDIFGSSLGTGDYGHLLIDHAPMLMRRFLSMTEFSQQGFEASHQLWLKATSHDQHGEASSRKTLENQNTFQFYFSGCGWKAKSISWDSGDILWIKLWTNSCLGKISSSMYLMRKEHAMCMMVSSHSLFTTDMNGIVNMKI